MDLPPRYRINEYALPLFLSLYIYFNWTYADHVVLVMVILCVLHCDTKPSQVIVSNNS
jgi:hypothetical protein